MKSLERRFNNIAKKNTNLSSYMWFAKAIQGQGFSKRIIALYFNKLVENDDYILSEKRAVLKYLNGLSYTPANRVEAGMICPLTPP